MKICMQNIQIVAFSKKARNIQIATISEAETGFNFKLKILRGVDPKMLGGYLQKSPGGRAKNRQGGVPKYVAGPARTRASICLKAWC